MQTYIVLLRGVMPSGKNKVPMAQLRQILSGAGFSNVRTYIATGNVLLGSELSASSIAAKVRELIKNHLGPDLAVIVRTPQEIRSLLDRNPFNKGHELTRLFFVLFESTPKVNDTKKLRAQDYGDEELALLRNAAVLYIPGPYGKGRLSNNYLEKQLGISCTMRNLNTLGKLIALAKQ